MKSKKKAVPCNPSESFPHKFFVTYKSIIWVKEKIGSGGQMDVDKVHVFPTDRFVLPNQQIGSSSRTFTASLKTAKDCDDETSPKRRNLREILNYEDSVEGVRNCSSIYKHI